MAELGLDLDALLEQEEEPGLGNGGLGRLAACYLDSLATLEVPAIGYGIRYEFGIFDQEIRDGWQVELTDKWLRFGNPWEIARPEIDVRRQLRRAHRALPDAQGRHRVRWVPERSRQGVAYDTPVLGYRVATTNMLRLWKAEATEAFDFDAFNVGDYYGAVEEKIASENISKVLYPNDEPEAGKQLRLEQQYFFVSCSLQDMIRLHLMRGKRLDEFDAYWAVQLNDTHPAIAVAELMRLLVDEHRMEWDEAWAITQRTCGYTNHTLLPEALEKWPLPLFGGAAAAAPRDHPRDQPPVPRRGAAAASRATRTCVRRAVAHRRSGRAVRAHGAPRRRSAATRSTAWRRCTPSCSSRPCSSDFCASDARRSSSTSPTASRPGAGCC